MYKTESPDLEANNLLALLVSILCRHENDAMFNLLHETIKQFTITSSPSTLALIRKMAASCRHQMHLLDIFISSSILSVSRLAQFLSL